ncbi:MAG TPA: extracellular solute-binding protein [Phycisphaerae bacterium]
MKNSLRIGALSLSLALWASASMAAEPGAGKTITILWAKWAPADALQKLCEDYKTKTGTSVVVDQKPWSDIDTVKNQEFSSRSATYDIIIGDSQWIGQGVTAGHYLELTDLYKSNAGLFKDVAPAALSFYAEYPKKSGKYYAVPCESDAMAVAYRKDLFEDPKHKEGYKKFVNSLPQDKERPAAEMELTVPKTWSHLLLIATYFKRSAGVADLAGIVMPTVANYDQAAMSYETMLWAFGGDWGDQEKMTATIGSSQATQALAFMKQLVDVSSNQGATMDYGDVLTTYTSGRSAMAMTFFAFFPAFSSTTEDKDYAAKTGYFNVPAGPVGRFTALGGQGLSVNAHIDPARQDAAKEFIKWFSSKDVQTKWASMGGFTADTAILKSDAFKKAAPYNPLFEEAFGMMKDFWNIPRYDQLLSSAQSNITATLQGKMTPDEAIKTMQAAHDKILKK